MRPLESCFLGLPWAGMALFQATLLTGAGLMLWFVCQRGGPALRAACLSAALLGVVVVPLLGLISPVWLPVPEPPALTAAIPLLQNHRPADPWAEEMPAGLAAAPVTEPTFEPPVEDEFPAGDSPESSAPVAAAAGAPSTAGMVSVILLRVWLIGSLAYLMRALFGLAALRHFSRTALPLDDPAWAACVERLTQQFGVPTVELRESALIRSPLTLGLRRAVILLPAACHDWPATQRELVLAHELAHVRRRDFVVGLLGELAVAVYWFHPLVRWMADRLRLEQEFAADAWAAATDSKPYVRCLARLALEIDRDSASLAPALWRRRPEIMRRIHMLQNHPGSQAARLGRRATWVLALTAVLAYVTVAGVGYLRSADEPSRGDAATEAKAADIQVLKDCHGDALPQGAMARGGTVRFRHASSSIAYSPDGMLLASGGHDNQIRLFDAATGKEIRRFVGHQPRTYKPDVDPESPLDTLISVVRDGCVCSVTFAPDGKVLASGGWDDYIRLWDVATGKEIRKIDAHQAMVTKVVFSPDGKFLASRGGLDGLVKLWDPTTGTLLQKFTGLSKINPWRFNHDAALAIAPDSKTVVVTARKALVFFDVATGAERKRLESNVYGICVAYSPDGQLLATGGVDEGKDVYSLRIWDVTAGKELRKCELPKNEPPTYLAFAPDRNDRLAAVVAEDVMHIFDVNTGKSVADLQHYWPSRVIWSRDGKTVVSAGSGPTIRHWDAATSKELFATFDGHQASVSSVALAGDGKVAASGGESVRLWDPATGKALRTIPVKGGVASVAFSPNGKLVASAGRDRLVHLWNVESGESVKELKGHKNQLSAIAFSPDGKLLASGDVQSTIRIWDVESGMALHVIDNKSGTEALTLAFSPDSTRLACAGAWNDSSFLPKPGSTIKINGKEVKVDGGFNIQGVEMTRKEGYFVLMWDARTGKELQRYGGLKDKIRSVAFAPDGKVLAAASKDGTIGMWDTGTAKERLFFLAHPRHTDSGFSASPCIAFGLDGKTLLSASNDRTLRVWNAVTGQELKQFHGSDAFGAIALGRDGKTVVTGSADTAILIWDITLPAPAPRAGNPVITLQ